MIKTESIGIRYIDRERPDYVGDSSPLEVATVVVVRNDGQRRQFTCSLNLAEELEKLLIFAAGWGA